MKNEKLFTKKQILVITGLFLCFILAANNFATWLGKTYFDIVPVATWPMNIMDILPSPKTGEMLFLVGQVVVFVFGLKWVRKRGFRLPEVLFFALLLIFFSNLTHSWKDGFLTPHSGDGQYYADIGKVVNPVQFLSVYNDIQPSLSLHSKSHPPGAVLTIYALDKVSVDPGMVSLWILVLSVLGSGYFFHKNLLARYGSEVAGLGTLLLLLTPAVMIYYCACIDALIATYAVIFIYFLFRPERWGPALAMMGALFLFSFSNFAAVFLLPVFLGYEWFIRKDLSRFGIVAGGLVLLYGLIYLVTGYDHIGAFIMASKIENSPEIQMLAQPAVYVFTRVQGVMEVVLLLGPFLLILLRRGLGGLRTAEKGTWLLFWLIIGAFAAMLISGAYKCAETGRAALYLYPFLLLPVAAALHRSERDARSTELLVGAVFAQGLFMQFMGSYFW